MSSKMVKQGITLLLIMLLTFIIAGCSFGSKETMKEMDAPQINYIEEGEELVVDEAEGPNTSAAEGEIAAETSPREIYLISEEGLVVPQTFDLPRTEAVLRQSLEYLVDGGPVSNILPNGFRAVLPAGTEIDVKLEDGLAVADFSEEFKNYQPEDELKILQAITWTLTQFDTVDKVQIRINGYEQQTMPVNNTPIGESYSRANGINIEAHDVVDVVNSTSLTLYFLAQTGENAYYVPVTRRVPEGNDKIQEVVNQLLAGPSIFTNLLTDFRQGVELLEKPRYDNGLVTLNFNEAILSQLQGTAISDDVLNVLVLSLTEQAEVDQVAIEVNGENNVLKTSGDVLTEPVSRPSMVNTGKF